MRHIIERAIVPHNPSASSIINKEKYNLFAPEAGLGQGRAGMAAFNPDDFDVRNGVVYLNANIGTSLGDALAGIVTNTKAITAEETRAKTAEGNLSKAITAEETRAKTAEGNLSNAITAEKTRAETAEDNLSKAIATEKLRAETAEDNLSKAIATEKLRAETAEDNLSKAILFTGTDKTLIIEEKIMRVDTTSEVTENSGQPITSGAVYQSLNIIATLLKNI